MSWIFIEAEDVWLFRDARPFPGGGGHTARSLFPPTPLTVQGALRSLILGHSQVDWQAFRQQSTPEARACGELIGRPGGEGQSPTLGSFSMEGPFLARVEGNRLVRYAPLPADVRRTSGDNPRYFSLRPTRKRLFDANWPSPGLFPLWPEVEQDVEAVEEPVWLSETMLDSYLLCGAFQGHDELLSYSESRLGIALDHSRRRPLERMLYQVELTRPARQVGLLVRLADSVPLPQPSGTMSLGGEARSAYYRTVPDQELTTVNVGAGLGGSTDRVPRFKVMLLTPAYFTDGWQPADGDAGWSGLLGANVKLVAAAIGRPQPIGGWDLAARGGRGWHKPLRPYVPAGSVYFFESDSPVAPPRGAVTQTPSGELPLDRLGFGQVVVGKWEWLE